MAQTTRHHHKAGYTAALQAEQEVDFYLDKRNRQNAEAFEAGWFDALEDLSDFQNNCAVAGGWLPAEWRR